MVRESGLNELHEVLVLTVITGMVMEFLKVEVVSMYGSELRQLEASDRRQRAMNVDIKLGHVLSRSWLRAGMM